MTLSWARFRVALFQKAPGALLTHLLIVVITMVLAIAISVPVGILLTRPKFRRFGMLVLNILNILQTIPGLAVLAFTMPILGLGLKPAIVALLFQSLLPIVRNTIAGLLGVNADVKEAAAGMGMSQARVLQEVELPLAMPIILSGIRTATVYVVSTATLASMIGAGGLGDMIFGGLALMIPEYLIVGAGLGALMAIAFDRALSYLEHMITPPGMRVE
ncbi:Binding-protein-dependent transport system inner membrane component [Acididesulfobacillus acetoxydans]|uniref:Binding-protein-dependent transport system inner membrane component n=1 Tax=Acididesulfobacillus acetoxydans TaxID=1561005 RepID=A0A8S0WMF6_9FIRM|nr:ABC transporter permease [Acididesulfobacillus acetoxydans]CAA7600564.1 Binding-protein-dependent transport system inner membrane component [Acididesulfobacillus acetoxydans]CEJ06698.1 Choline transport system permease protein OpuBB [Acididesulfobacillus acetoxydans]